MVYAADRGLNAFPPNYLSWDGAYSIAGVGERVVFSPIMQRALGTLAAVGVGPLFVFALRNLFTTENLVGKIFSIFYFVGIVAQTYSGQGMFGRYMIPLLMALAPTIVQGVVSRTTSKLSFFASLAILAVVSATLFLEAVAFDGAVWKQAEVETTHGVPAMSIDAGFAWYGYHSSSSVNQNPADDGVQNFSPYVDMFSDAQECVVIGAHDPDFQDAEPVASYKRYLFFGPETNIYREKLSSCK